MSKDDGATRTPLIAIDGAMSTGKTTLFAALGAHFADRLRYVPEASRSVAPEFGLRTADDWGSLLGDRARLESFFKREEDWLDDQLREGGPTLVDSSHHVIAAYRAHFGARPSTATQRYSLTLYCPPSTVAVEDGFRFIKGRDQVDARLREVLALREPGIVQVLPTGQDRLPFAIAAVETFLAGW